MPRTTDLSKLDDMIVYTAFMTGNLEDMQKFDTSDRNWWESLLVSTFDPVDVHPLPATN